MFAFYTLRNWIDDFTFSNYFICFWDANTTCKLADKYFQRKILFIPWPCHRFSPFTGRLAPSSVLFLDEKARTLRYFKESYEYSHHRTGLHKPLGSLYDFSLLACIRLIDPTGTWIPVVDELLRISWMANLFVHGLKIQILSILFKKITLVALLSSRVS